MDTRLRNLLILSLALHALVVFTWYKPSIKTTVYHAHETLNVRLVAKQAVGKTTAPEPQSELQAQSYTPHATKPAITTDNRPSAPIAQTQDPTRRQSSDKSHTSSSTNLLNTATTQSTTNTQTNLSNERETSPIAKLSAIPQTQAIITMNKLRLDDTLQQQLFAKLASHFSYPRLAQRRNWQGEVKLGLRIEANGRLSHIRIIKSSGHGILDRAALRSLQAISSLPESRQWLHGNAYDTVIPVEYRLTES